MEIFQIFGRMTVDKFVSDSNKALLLCGKINFLELKGGIPRNGTSFEQVST